MDRGGFVYMMASGVRGALYIGVTSDLMRRVSEHRLGLREGFTKDYGVTRLVWFEPFAEIGMTWDLAIGWGFERL